MIVLDNKVSSYNSTFVTGGGGSGSGGGGDNQNQMLRPSIEKLALELAKLENEKFSIPALKLLLSCIYVGKCYRNISICPIFCLNDDDDDDDDGDDEDDSG